MVAIEEILWNIFTYYSLNGNPKDPARLHAMGLLKFCKDIMALDNTMTERALTQAELQLIYTAAIKSPEKQPKKIVKEKVDKIDFDAFLSCLIRIAQKCYPSCRNSEEAMQQLLMDNVLPLATRRKPVTIALLLKQPHIEALFKYYEDALLELYKFYTTSADLRRKGNNMMRSTAHHVNIFEEEIGVIEEAKLRAARELSASNKMAYLDFIRFATDFGLVTGLGITTLDLGDIYLTVTYFSNFTPSLRRIEFKEFWECLVRCALVAFQEKKNLTTEIKIKGLFLSIWRHVQSSMQDNMKGYGTLQGGGFNTYKGALLRGTQLLNDRFVAAWTKDDYHDYLSPLVAPTESIPAVTGPPVPPPVIPSTLSNLLKSPMDKSKARSRTATADATELASPSKEDGKESPNKKNNNKGKGTQDNLTTNNNNNQKDFDEITRDKLFRIADENVEQSDNFLVKTKNNRLIRIMISDYEEIDDPRLAIGDLRKLLYLKPSIAELLYEEMLDAGLVEEDLFLPESEEQSAEEQEQQHEEEDGNEIDEQGEDDHENDSHVAAGGGIDDEGNGGEGAALSPERRRTESNVSLKNEPGTSGKHKPRSNNHHDDDEEGEEVEESLDGLHRLDSNDL